MKDYKAESMSQQNLLYRDTDSCNMKELVETEESIEIRSSIVTIKSMSQQMMLNGLVATKELNVATYFKMGR